MSSETSPLLTDPSGGSAVLAANGIPGPGEERFSAVDLLSEEDYREMLAKRKSLSRLLLALGFWLEYWGFKMVIDYHAQSTQRIKNEVEGFVDVVLEELLHHCPRFEGNRLGIGSFYNRTKLRPADEFDFVCQSQMDTADLRFVHQQVPSTEAQGVDKPDFFRIFCSGVELDALQWRTGFQSAITDILRRRYVACSIQCNGPALSFFLSSAGSKHLKPPVKVDLTFGIPLEMGPSSIMWPLTTVVDRELTLLPPRLGSISRCHFIPYGDLWRVSFAEYEGMLIKSLSTEKRNCLVAIKVDLKLWNKCAFKRELVGHLQIKPNGNLAVVTV